jgi:hypothetical protein
LIKLRFLASHRFPFKLIKNSIFWNTTDQSYQYLKKKFIQHGINSWQSKTYLQSVKSVYYWLHSNTYRIYGMYKGWDRHHHYYHRESDRIVCLSECKSSRTCLMYILNPIFIVNSHIHKGLYFSLMILYLNFINLKKEF